MRRPSLAIGLVVTLGSVPALSPAQSAPNGPSRESGATARADLSAAKPGRDPNQPIDSAYTAKIKEYTTETFFLSPLVDYLPAGRNVPTPKAVLGDIAGAPTKLPYSKEVYEYMRLLEKASPRVKVYSIGKTEEGREMIAVAVASEELLGKLDANKAQLAKPVLLHVRTSQPPSPGAIRISRSTLHTRRRSRNTRRRPSSYRRSSTTCRRVRTSRRRKPC